MRNTPMGRGPLWLPITAELGEPVEWTCPRCGSHYSVTRVPGAQVDLFRLEGRAIGVEVDLAGTNTAHQVRCAECGAGVDLEHPTTG